MPIIPKNNKEKKQKVVCTLNDLEKRKVVEHNSLITSIAKMDKTTSLAKVAYINLDKLGVAAGVIKRSDVIS